MTVASASGGGGGGDSTLTRRVCATGVLNLPPCSGVGKPKKDTLFWSYHSFLVLYCIVLYCIVLETKIMFMLYLFKGGGPSELSLRDNF